MPLFIAGKIIPTDNEGYLANLNDWNEEVAHALAKSGNIQLSDQHWEIILLMRRFYMKYKISPAMRVLSKTIKIELGQDKGQSIYLMKLFPGSPAKLASKIAGLPRPTNCI
ncbi:MAG: TusE/DsrC/DsvC family sulfur relay protein [Pseudomonadales bacterium]|nr:TusE/DsrC/DsvC family sulfur relay protein [Pseudomonadales bacterium]